MSLQTLRIAVCQISCHPALAIGDRDYMAEPFLSRPGQTALADFSRRSLDMSELQEACRDSYLGWHSKRVTAIVDWIKALNPRPDLLVFPEASIPSELLTFLSNVSQETGMAIFGGTHSLRLTHDQVRLYKSLGLKKHDLERLNRVRDQPSLSVLPIFSSGRAFFHPKRVPSIFEIIDVSRPMPPSLVPEAIELTMANEAVRILPLVCSEALQHTSFPGDIDLVVIPAFNDGIERYLPIMQHLSARRIPCVFCNDGHFGHSCVQLPLDKRPDYWWWDEPHQGRLPPGDAVLVIDIHFPYLAPQVGVSNPQSPVTLVALSQVAYSGQKGPGFSISHDLLQIASLSDNTAQAHRLNELIQEAQGTPLLAIKLAHLYRLARNGTASAYWWSALANDCLITDLPDLKGVEALLAAKCREVIQRLLQDTQIQDAALLGALYLFDRSCASLCSPDSEHKPLQVSASQPILDRADDMRAVQEFLDHPQQSLLIVVGLDGIGKTSVVNEAVSQTGRRIHRLAIESDTTLDFIGEWLLRCFGVNDRPPSGKPSDAVLSEWITEYVRRDNIIVIEKGQLLLGHGIWRDTRTPDFLVKLAGLLKKQGSKLIVESSFQFDLPSAEPASLRRYRIGGLDKEQGTLLLDQHLRRSGVDPNNYDKGERQEIASRLGGHPLALIIASEYIEQKGLGPVLTELRGRKGVHYEIVRRVLRDLDLSHEQKVVLSLLSLARAPLRADVLAQVVGFDPLPAVRQLIQLSFVERSKNDNIEIVSLLRGIDVGHVLAAAMAQKFHRAAAQFFLALAPLGDRVTHLRCTVEARYHGLLSDDPSLAPDLPGIIDGALGAADALARSDRLEDAKVIVDQLLAAQPSAELFELAALIYAGLGNCAEALVFAKEAASTDSERVWILTEVGRRSMHIHREDLARNAIEVAKAIGHDSPFVAVLEGKIQLKHGQIEQAIGSFKRGAVLTETQPRRSDGWAHFHLGRTLLRQGKVADAIDALNRGERIEEERGRKKRDALVAIRTQLAIAYVYEGRMDVAERYFELVAELDSGNPEVARAFSIFRAASGAPTPALDAIAKLDPGRAKNRFDRCQIHLFRGLFFLNIGYREKASEEFSLAHRADATNVFVMLRWADNLEQMARDLESEGESESARYCANQAKDIAEKILSFAADSAEARAILERLYDTFGIR